MAAFATGVPPHIYEFHLYLGNSAILSGTQAKQFRAHFLSYAEGFHTRLAKPPTRALRPIIPNNACTLCITAAAGTELAGASSPGTVRPLDVSQEVFFPVESALRSENLHHTRGVAASGFRPLCKIPHCCLP